MLNINFLRNNRGQAFLEGVFILPVIVVLIFSVVWFARVLLTWQQLVSAARYGTDMIANTSLSKEDIKKDIENYLTHKMIEGRKLDKEKIKEICIDIKDYTVADINILDISKLFTAVKSLVLPSAEMSSVSITYAYDMPKILKWAGKDEFEIKTRLSVLSGTGCKSAKHKRDK